MRITRIERISLIIIIRVIRNKVPPKESADYGKESHKEFHPACEKWAADEFRSTNGQLQWIITEALRKARRLPKKKRTTENTAEDDERNE